MYLQKSLKGRLKRGKNLAVYIDSNVFFYAKILDRQYGGACAEILNKIEKDELRAATSTLVIVELANALSKYGLSDEVKDVVDAIFSLNMSIFEVDPLDVRTAANVYDEFRISPYDCVHIAIMKRASIREIISADKDFDKITWIRRLDPKNFKIK